MLKLIKLEWKKNNIRKYIRNAVIMALVLLFLILIMAGELEADMSMESYNGSAVNTAVDLFIHMGCIVFTDAMIASFIVLTLSNFCPDAVQGYGLIDTAISTSYYQNDTKNRETNLNHQLFPCFIAII